MANQSFGGVFLEKIRLIRLIGLIVRFVWEMGKQAQKWSRLTGLNRRPEVYKTTALPTELSRLVFDNIIP